MSKKDDGGSAFPIPDYDGPMIDPDGSGMVGHGKIIGRNGISMRDYFAAAAISSGQCPCNSYEDHARAEWAYAEADAMLAERSKP